MGGSDPDVAKRWLETMINVFAVLNNTKDRQVNFVVFQFGGPVRAWRIVVRAQWER